MYQSGARGNLNITQGSEQQWHLASVCKSHNDGDDRYL
jgi:hypothetical protein